MNPPMLRSLRAEGCKTDLQRTWTERIDTMQGCTPLRRNESIEQRVWTGNFITSGLHELSCDRDIYMHIPTDLFIVGVYMKRN